MSFDKQDNRGISQAIYYTFFPHDLVKNTHRFILFWITTILFAGIFFVLAFLLTHYQTRKKEIESSQLLFQNKLHIISKTIYQGEYLGALQSFANTSSILVESLLKGLRDHPELLEGLERIRGLYQASIVYVMNQNGTVIASTQWEQGKSLTGNNYAFRPYFRYALEGKNYVYGAIGVTTLKRGFYYSTPVIDQRTSSIIGVLVMKQDILWLEQTLEQESSSVILAILTGKNHIFVSNKQDWNYSEPGTSNQPLLKPFPIQLLSTSGTLYNHPAFKDTIIIWDHLGISDEDGPWKIVCIVPLSPHFFQLKILSAIFAASIPILVMLLFSWYREREKGKEQRRSMEAQHFYLLKQQDEKFEDVLEKLGIAYVVLNEHLLIQRFNVVFNQLFPRLARKVLRGDPVPFSDLLASPQPHLFNEMFSQHSDNNGKNQFQIIKISLFAEKGLCPFECFLYPAGNSQSKDYYIFLRDISSSEIQEKLLHAQWQILEDLLNLIPLPIIEIDKDAKVLKVNTIAQKYFSIDSLGKSVGLSELIPTLFQQPEMSTQISHFIANPQKNILELTIPHHWYNAKMNRYTSFKAVLLSTGDPNFPIHRFFVIFIPEDLTDTQKTNFHIFYSLLNKHLDFFQFLIEQYGYLSSILQTILQYPHQTVSEHKSSLTELIYWAIRQREQIRIIGEIFRELFSPSPYETKNLRQLLQESIHLFIRKIQPNSFWQWADDEIPDNFFFQGSSVWFHACIHLILDRLFKYQPTPSSNDKIILYAETQKDTLFLYFRLPFLLPEDFLTFSSCSEWKNWSHIEDQQLWQFSMYLLGKLSPFEVRQEQNHSLSSTWISISFSTNPGNHTTSSKGPTL